MSADDHLIKSYVDVCNQALVMHRNKFPFKQILGAARQADYGKNIEVRLFGSSDERGYILTFEGETIYVRSHGVCKDCKCDRKWHVDKHYLEQVEQNPRAYILNPAKINWEWLYDVGGSLKN